jgi:hypothetical protein
MKEWLLDIELYTPTWHHTRLRNYSFFCLAVTLPFSLIWLEIEEGKKFRPILLLLYCKITTAVFLLILENCARIPRRSIGVI